MRSVCFDLDITDGVAHIVLKRGNELNTMVPAFWQELPEMVTAIDAGAEARVIVISSTGKHFTAGMDLSVFDLAGSLLESDPDDPQYIGQRREAFRRLISALQDTFNVLEAARIPVLVAVQGGCIGGGMDLISATDIRYCTRDAFFCIHEINVGMTADVGTFPRLCHLIPQGWVREMAYTGRQLTADKAKEIGLVNEVYETQTEMLEAVLATAREIASKAPLAVAGSKVILNYARDHSITDGLDYIATWQAGMFQPADIMEGMAAQEEKRTPTYGELQAIKKTL
ncbi:MAG: crotonase/enoyl-CoA hydratase family protein [Gammaproteobacteria bacterium]|nr:crotonase/enoyl-CoA hydratase family protein [Gammaproteobacteria bacterium]